MKFEEVSNTKKGLIVLGVLVIGLLVSYNWDTITGWFSSSTPPPTPKPTDCDPNKKGFQIDGTQNQTKCGVGGTGRFAQPIQDTCDTLKTKIVALQFQIQKYPQKGLVQQLQTLKDRYKAMGCNTIINPVGIIACVDGLGNTVSTHSGCLSCGDSGCTSKCGNGETCVTL